jgi:hypothetical protein
MALIVVVHSLLCTWALLPAKEPPCCIDVPIIVFKWKIVRIDSFRRYLHRSAALVRFKLSGTHIWEFSPFHSVSVSIAFDPHLIRILLRPRGVGNSSITASMEYRELSSLPCQIPRAFSPVTKRPAYYGRKDLQIPFDIKIKFIRRDYSNPSIHRRTCYCRFTDYSMNDTRTLRQRRNEGN